MRYKDLSKRIDALEVALQGQTFFWTDRNGKHAGDWLKFLKAIQYPEEAFENTKGAKLPQEKCPLISFDMDQMDKLPMAQQMGLSVLMESVGFPALELVTLHDGREVWQRKSGIVKLEVFNEQKT